MAKIATTGHNGGLIVCQGKDISPTYWTIYRSAYILGSPREKPGQLSIEDYRGENWQNYTSGGYYKDSDPDCWVLIPSKYYVGEPEANEWGEVAP